MLWHIAKFKLTKLQRSLAYDVAIRLPVLGWSTVLALVSVVDLEQYAQAADPVLPRAIYAENIVMRLSVIAYLILLASAILVRMRPVKKARGAEPRISAFMGTFLITLIVLFPRCDLAPAAGCVSTLLVLLGDSIATAVLIQLRRSFSIMAEARQLTISGAYRFVRHPLYLAEESRDNRKCHAISVYLDGDAPHCADRLPNSADEERGDRSDGGLSGIFKL